MNYRCKVCGGELEFDPTAQKLKCPYCTSEFEVEEYESHDHAEAAREEDGLAVYTCSHCGAEVLTQKNTLSTNCLYCGNPLVFSHTQSNEDAPTHVLPFLVDKKQLEDIYEAYVKTKPFAPDLYKTANVLDKIQPIYIPFWLFDMEVEGSAVKEGERTHSHRSGDYRITRHDVFQYPVKSRAIFHSIPVDASKKTPNDAMDSIEPFDLGRLEEFNTGYLAGFKAEQYDEAAAICQERAHTRAANTTVDLMDTEHKALVGDHMVHSETTLKAAHARYVLLPTYLLYTNPDIAKQFNAETNPDILQAQDLIAVNGQTGKVAANIPVDKRKRSRYFWKVFGLSIIPCIVIGLLLAGIVR